MVLADGTVLYLTQGSGDEIEEPLLRARGALGVLTSCTLQLERTTICCAGANLVVACGILEADMIVAYDGKDKTSEKRRTIQSKVDAIVGTAKKLGKRDTPVQVDFSATHSQPGGGGESYCVVSYMGLSLTQINTQTQTHTHTHDDDDNNTLVG